MHTDCDILIVGAGAAGLQAATELKKRKKKIVILEATDRFGGRVWTENHRPQSMKNTLPVEYGAEFIHGKAPHTKKILREKGQTFCHLHSRFHLLRKGKVEYHPQYWSELSKVLKKIPKTKGDQSFLDFLQKNKTISTAKKKMAVSFIEGFQAADPALISANSIKDLVDSLSEQRLLGKPLAGYHTFLESLAIPIQKDIRFNHVVKKVSWKRGYVTVDGVEGQDSRGRDFTYSAKKVLVTVSVGVLKDSPKEKVGIDFSPRPQALNFLKSVEMGHVFKTVIELNPEFFKRYENSGFPFISAPDFKFHTWWGSDPFSYPIVTAWSGGLKSQFLSSLTKEKRKKILIAELAKISGHSVSEIKKQWVRHFEYDWNKAPFFKGAYSYPKVGEENLEQKKFQIVEDTLYFAGEAFDSQNPATVEGALQSGLKIAREMA